MRLHLALYGVRRRPWPVLLSVSAVGWAVLLVFAHGASMAQFCLAPVGNPIDRGLRSLHAQIAMVTPVDLALSWFLMLLAMTPPLIADQIEHIRARSLPSRRTRSGALFLLGYVTLWVAAGVGLTFVAMLLRAASGVSNVLPVLLSLLIAVAWQLTPWKQRCLNRCHAMPRLSAFGIAADRDALVFGLKAGMWCVGGCWALMMPALLLPEAHVPLMAVAAALLLLERCGRPRPPTWRWQLMQL